MWQVPPLPANEPQRLAALEACGIMDTAREEQFDRLTRLAQRLYSADVAFLGFIDNEQQWLKSVTSSLIGSFVPRRQSVCQMIVSSGEPLVVGDLQTDARFDGHPLVPNLPLRFYAGVPLLATPDLAIGSLCIMREKPGIESDFDIGPLQSLAAIAIDELELRGLNRELTRMTRVDPLTGLANRRGFDEALERAEIRCRRTGEALAVMMIDIDYFKVLNDSFGHQGGDAALQAIGSVLLQAVVRKDDVIARFGGEEFAAILTGSDISGAQRVAERIRLALSKAAIPHPRTGSLTVSIGITARPGETLDAERMIAEADAALYEAKRRGRDTVVTHAR